MIKAKMRNRQGSGLISVIVLLVVVMTILFSMLFSSDSQWKFTRAYDNQVNSIHFAEAGLNQYLWALNSGDINSIILDQPNAYHSGYYQITEISSTESSKNIQVEGWRHNAQESSRIIEATLTKRSFTQYAYLSNRESIPNVANEIWFGSGDVIYGPLHVNDTLRVQGNATFYGNVTYTNNYIKTGNPVFKSGEPQKVSTMTFPTDNSSLKQWADIDGYTYTGRTAIRFNADGTITTRNPNRNNGNPETRSLPQNGVIYVDGAIAGGPGIMRHSNKFNYNVGNAFVYGHLKGRVLVAAAGDIFITHRDPTANSHFTGDSSAGGVRYSNTSFNVNTTTGEINITPSNATDMLGLIANNNIYILTHGWLNHNNINSPSIEGDSSPQNGITIHGAIFTINGIFGNESFVNTSTSMRPNDPKNLTVRGSIIQQNRGIMALANNSIITSGLIKDYAHDPRMIYDSPPKFIEPAESGWEILKWRELN